jgi:glycerol kinase
MQSLVLAVDQGTTGSRAILFDRSAAAVAVHQAGFRQIFPAPGWVEHDPDEILKTQTEAIAGAIKKAGTKPGQIVSAGITNQRETTVVWNKNTGRPVYNAIVWQCRRTADICGQLVARGLEEQVSKKTGLVIDPYFSATKIKWILDNVAGARASAQRGELLFGTIDSWLIWNFTEGRIHATDVTNASRTMLFDIDRLCWDSELCSELEIPMSMLPEVRRTSGDFGSFAKIEGLEELSGVPINAAAGDQQAALFGQACFDAGDVKNTYGTGCFLLMNTGRERAHSKNRLLTTVAWQIGARTDYALEGSIFHAGSIISWLKDNIGIIKTPDEINTLAGAVSSSEGVVLVPAFTGLGAPHWDAAARASVTGLTRGSTKEHIARAALEAIAHQTADLTQAMQQDSGITPLSLKADGGASVSDILMQLQADLLGIPVDRPANVEATAAGAAYFAGLASGIWADLAAISKLRQKNRLFTPAMSKDERAGLRGQWADAVARVSQKNLKT